MLDEWPQQLFARYLIIFEEMADWEEKSQQLEMQRAQAQGQAPPGPRLMSGGM